LFMSTPSTEQGQILYCSSLVIPSQIKAGSCFKPKHTEKLPPEKGGDFPLFSRTLCNKDCPVAILHSSALAHVSLQHVRSVAHPSCTAKPKAPAAGQRARVRFSVRRHQGRPRHNPSTAHKHQDELSDLAS